MSLHHLTALTGAVPPPGRASQIALARLGPDAVLAGALDRESNPFIGADAGAFSGQLTGVVIQSDLDKGLADADFLIDFTRPEGTLLHLAACRKLGVNLKQVKGSAAGGRITIEDVEAFVRERMTQPAVPAAAPAAPGFGVVQALPLPDFSRFGPVEKQPMNKIFRTAASNLHAAWVTIPHVTQHDLADITELEAARRKYVKANPNAPKITMTAIILLTIDPWLALVTLLPLPFIGWLIHSVRDRLRVGFEKIDRVWSEVTNVLSDTISGIRVVKAFAQEEREIRRFEQANWHNLQVNDRLNRLWSLFSPTVTLMTEFGLLVLWAFGIWLVAHGFPLSQIMSQVA